MRKQDMERIVQGYYDALEEGRILGRKCTRCDHIEFPPYLACNECGCLDTEWVELNGMRGLVTQVLPTIGAFGDPEYRKINGDYWAISIKIPDIDEFCSSLLHIDPDRYDEFCERIYETEIYVHPIIIQDEDTKIVVWELDDDEFKKMPDPASLKKWNEPDAGQAEEIPEKTECEIDVATDPVLRWLLPVRQMLMELQNHSFQWQLISAKICPMNL